MEHDGVEISDVLVDKLIDATFVRLYNMAIKNQLKKFGAIPDVRCTLAFGGKYIPIAPLNDGHKAKITLLILNEYRRKNNIDCESLFRLEDIEDAVDDAIKEHRVNMDGTHYHNKEIDIAITGEVVNKILDAKRAFYMEYDIAKTSK